MRAQSIVIACIFSLPLLASVKELTSEFLGANVDIYKASSALESSKLDREITLSSKSWSFDFTGTKTDSDTPSSLSSTIPYKQGSYSLSFSRPLSWGGAFEFANELSETSYKLTGTDSHYFSQSLSYSQDLGANLFGRGFKKDVAVATKIAEASEANLEKTTEMKLLTMLSQLSTVRLNKNLILLQEESLKRARKRLNLIRKRVRDGLRERVDLYQSQMSYIRTEEEIQNLKKDQVEKIEELSKSFHRDIRPEEVELFSPDKDRLLPSPKGDLAGNHSLSFAELQLQSAVLSFEKSDDLVFPTITLATSYSNNSYNSTSGDAFSQGKLFEPKDSFSVSVNVAMPLGFETEKLSRSKAKVQKMVKEKEKIALLKNLELAEKSLLKTIASLEKSLALSKKRVSLANKSLKEYNALYSRGRADLDQLIGAEEDLIGTEKNYINYLFQREIALFKLASIYGNLKDYVGNR